MSDETITIEPDYSRLVEALRDTGYSLNTAIADIIDNSIAANASNVDVYFEFDGEYEIYIAIVDDGEGMDRDGLIEGLRLGSPQRESLESLGKFGMGLKTASTSFCRKLVVSSRPGDIGSTLQGIYDLDEVKKTGLLTAWIGDPTLEQLALLKRTAGEGHGTLVEWRKVDRILENYDNPAGAPRSAAKEKLTKSLKEHLALVFERYLDPSDARVGKHVTLSVNGERITPFDPFCVDLTKPIAINEDIEIAVEQEDGSVISSVLKIRLFRIPNGGEWPSGEREKAARVLNDNQGVYVYRENRLIHGPDWLGEFRKEPHYNLARVELSFGHQLDEAFKVDIKKSKIELAPALKAELRKYFVQVRTAAENVRRGKVAADAVKGGNGLHSAADKTIDNRAGQLATANIESVNADGSAQVTNKLGTSKRVIRIVAGGQGQAMRIEPVESLPDAVLWMPSIIENRPAVSLNCSHDFYSKVYLANKDRQNVIEALDFMLWSLAQAELNNIDDSNRIAFEEFRIETSRNLRRLTEVLPEPDNEGNSDESS